MAEELKQTLRDAGFSLVGIAPAVSPPGVSRLHDWLAAGYAGEMSYLERRKEAYSHPEHVLENVASVVMAAWNYSPPHMPSGGRNATGEETSSPRIAAYAHLPEDYHQWLRTKLQPGVAVLRRHFPQDKTRVVIDTAPLLERDFARLAGLGWFGKNTMLINKRQGSFLLLAAILTQTSLPGDEPHETAHCGSCTRCLDACPTEAFPQAGILDATRCISYLTIEQKGLPPLDLRGGIGSWLLGCDICQDVCPWNTKQQKRRERNELEAFDPLPESWATEASDDAGEFLTITEADFQARFEHTPLERPGRVGMARNAAIVLGNTGTARDWPAIEQGLRDPATLVRGASAWAAGELALRNPALRPIIETALRNQLAVEDNPPSTTHVPGTFEAPAELRLALERLSSAPLS
ncbi:MAG: tRNA epoxyqueuosine(34) reductase QueG [Planctomyces sp.]|nr:tRNA epoxyqueuosine(34) reductase QueG [Planctomyces sp.]